MAFDVFVSYSTKDKAITDTIVSSMEQNQIRCWYAPRDIKPSEDWAKAISNAIEQSKVFLLIFSGNSNQSQRVLDELNLAISQEITILPFRIENLEPDGAMRLHLSSRHWLDAYDPSWESHLKKLIHTVSATLETTITAEDIELPTVFRRKQKIRKNARVWRIAAGMIVTATVILIGWYGLSSTNKLGGGTDQEGGVAAEQAALTQAALDERCQIAFSSNRSGFLNLWLMDADGSNQTQVTYNEYGEFIGSWTLDGTEFIFFSWRDGDNEIFVMDSSGTNIRQLTDNDSNESMPRLSPDGEWIAFYSDSAGAFEIFKMKVDGSAVQQLTTDQGIYEEYDFPPAPLHLAWSPDGEDIAFISDRDGNAEIYVMDQDGGNIQQLTFNDNQDEWPVWSPEGNNIAFHSNRYGDYEIFLVNIDGSDVIQLTSNLGISTEPDWSLDGRIAFTSSRTGDSELWIMDGDGKNQQQLTFEEGYDGGPVWSPHCK